MERKNYKEYDDYYDEEEGGLDLVDLIFAVIRRWRLIVLITIPILGAGIFFAATRPTLYKAEVTMMLTNPDAMTSTGSETLNVDNNLILTYTQLAKSKDIMRRVIEKYDLNTSPEGLASSVNISSVTGTVFMKLSYTTGEEHLAAPIVNEVANEFIYKIAQVVRLRNISILEAATQAYQLPKNQIVIVVASLLLGLCCGCGVAGIIELLYKKLRKPSDIKSIIGKDMLGMIPEIEMDKFNKKEEGDESNE
jgi:capsular polysaccharide biosynthesis protein